MSIEVQRERVVKLFNRLVDYSARNMSTYTGKIQKQKDLGIWGVSRNQGHLNELRNVIDQRNDLVLQVGDYEEYQLAQMEQDMLVTLMQVGYFREYPGLYDELKELTESEQHGLYVEFKELLKIEGYQVLEDNEKQVKELRTKYWEMGVEEWELVLAAREEHDRLESNYSAYAYTVANNQHLPLKEQKQQQELLQEKREEINKLINMMPILRALPWNYKGKTAAELRDNEKVRESVDKVFEEILEANMSVRGGLASGRIAAYKIDRLMEGVLARKQYSDEELRQIGECLRNERQRDEIISITIKSIGIVLAIGSFFVGGTLLGIALKAGMALGSTAVGILDSGMEVMKSLERKEMVYAGLYGRKITDAELKEAEWGLVGSVLLFALDLVALYDAVESFRLLNKLGRLSKPAREALANMPDGLKLLQTLEIDDLTRITGDIDNISLVRVNYIGKEASPRLSTKAFSAKDDLIEVYGRGRITGNIAVAEIDVPGVSIELKSFSGTKINPQGFVDAKTQNRIFKTLSIDRHGLSNTPASWDRYVDTEARILEQIADNLGSNTQTVGTINLYTILEPCESCRYVIKQFIEKYKNITINIFWD